MKKVAPMDAKDKRRLISMIFTIPACPPTNLTAKYSGRADKIRVIITSKVFAPINAVMSIFYRKILKQQLILKGFHKGLCL